MIELHQFTNFANKPDVSPFCIKVEFFMKVNNIEYKCYMGDIRKAPKGKLPFIKDGEQIICDSEDIIKYLTKKHDIDMEEELFAPEKAVSYSMRKTLDEYLYFLLVYARWIDEEGWKSVKELFQELPFPFLLRKIIPYVARISLRKVLHGQGIGRHSRDEIIKLVNESFEHFSSFLEDKEFLMGEQLTLLDVTAFSFFTQIVNYPSFMTKEMSKYENLVSYEKRLFNKYYSKDS